MSNKNKKVNIQDLIDFLAKDSFTNKEELVINNKFGFTGTQQYYCHSIYNFCKITANNIEGQKKKIEQTYIRKQVSWVPGVYVEYVKVPAEQFDSLRALPENQWNKDLFFDSKTNTWREPIAPEPISPEDDAISIVESVVMSVYKNHKKNGGDINIPFIKESDFCYQYVGNDGKWHAFYPSIEKLISYAERFNKTDFLEFLGSDVCKSHRESFGPNNNHG